MTSTIEIAIHKADRSPKTDYIQVARIENKRVLEIDMEPIANAEPRMRIGDIYYAKVVRLLSSMRMAFVEIGEQRTALLHFAQVPLPRDSAYTDVAQYLRVGQLLPVQISKLPRGEKGAVVSGFVQIVGAFLIYQPYGNNIKVSQRIAEEPEQQRLKGIVNTLPSVEGGILVRSLAKLQPDKYLTTEWQQLRSEWEKIQAQIANSKKPKLLRAEWPLACCYIRDQIADVKLINVDDEEIYTQLQTFMQTWLQAWLTCLQYKPGKHALWYNYKIDDLIEKTINHKITLPSGGFIVVEATEAMITVDVNTGQYVKASAGLDIVYQTNIEAAHMLAQHLRLANLAGIIVVDFIGMKDTAQQQAVLSVLQEELAHDSAYTTSYGFSPLGLVEISRQRRGNTWMSYYK
jgi:ribonuclease G